MLRFILLLLVCSFLNSQTIRLSAGYDIGLHLGGAEDSQGNSVSAFENSISLPMKNLLDGGNGISFDVTFITASEEGSSSASMYGLRFSKSKYNGQKAEDEQVLITAIFTGGNTTYIGEELQVTTITPYFGLRGGSELLQGYFTLGLAITDYKWQFEADPNIQLSTGVGGHLGIGADLQNLGGTGIGINAEIGFQFVWSGNEKITEALKAAKSDISFFWTNHMFTTRVSAIYTLNLY